MTVHCPQVILPLIPTMKYEINNLLIETGHDCQRISYRRSSIRSHDKYLLRHKGPQRISRSLHSCYSDEEIRQDQK